jgi:hypothetical protein
MPYVNGQIACKPFKAGSAHIEIFAEYLYDISYVKLLIIL